MYAYIKGKVARLEPTHIVIDAGGVGYYIRIPVTTYEVVKGQEESQIFTHHHVAEDAHTLYGFATEEDKVIFQTLISVSGVGPGTALMALSQMRGREVANAIMTGNLAALQRIKGLGVKTAQRLTLELKTKMLKVLSSEPGSLQMPAMPNSNREEALNALVTLGIARPNAEKTLEAIVAEKGEDLAVEDYIRLALRR